MFLHTYPVGDSFSLFSFFFSKRPGAIPRLFCMVPVDFLLVTRATPVNGQFFRFFLFSPTSYVRGNPVVSGASPYSLFLKLWGKVSLSSLMRSDL